MLLSIMFYVHFWQTIFYIFYLSDVYKERQERIKNNTSIAIFTHLARMMTLLPHISVVITIMLARISLKKHHQYVILAFALWQLFEYGSNTKRLRILTAKEIAADACMLGVISLAMWVV